jgi:hypothetical protein
MAAKTPATTAVAAINPFREVVGHNYLASSVDALDATDELDVAVAVAARTECIELDRTDACLVIYYFSDIDDGDTFASGFKGVLATAWQGSDLDGDFVNAHVLNGNTGLVTFQVTGAGTDQSGWLWMLVQREGNNVPASVR